MIIGLIFMLALGMVTYQSLLPSHSSGSIGIMDKVFHAMAYAVLMAILMFARPRANLMSLALSLLVYGGVLELCQALMNIGRTGSVLDFLANGFGIALVVWAWSCLTRLKMGQV